MPIIILAKVCVNKDLRCDSWGKAGYCSPEKGYEDFMKKSCCATCLKNTNGKHCGCHCFNLCSLKMLLCNFYLFS